MPCTLPSVPRLNSRDCSPGPASPVVPSACLLTVCPLCAAHATSGSTCAFAPSAAPAWWIRHSSIPRVFRITAVIAVSASSARATLSASAPRVASRSTSLARWSASSARRRSRCSSCAATALTIRKEHRMSQSSELLTIRVLYGGRKNQLSNRNAQPATASPSVRPPQTLPTSSHEEVDERGMRLVQLGSEGQQDQRDRRQAEERARPRLVRAPADRLWPW